ncbi:MAG: hypothetical protein L0G82_05030 [Pseudomonas sp.]|nr:hypothetical protein [Pseudomonas sp.]
MLEALFSLVFEVVLYGKGYWTLKLVSAGRIQPKRWNDSLVALVGLVATLAWCVPLLLWLASLR